MRKWTLSLLLLIGIGARAQGEPIDTTAEQNAHPKRQWLIGGLTTAGYGGSFIFLNEAWYKDYSRSSFHSFNDVGEWEQMDKVGHAWTAYHTSRLTSAMWKWAGVPEKKAVALGTGSSLLYMLSIEYLDGRSTEWGWSWGDVGADAAGASLFALQQLGWKEQRVALKFSTHYTSYDGEALQQRANALFGKGFYERRLKDYNAQTYWLSFNLHSLFRESRLPAWLNISLGYSAEGMFGGYENIAYDKGGTITFDRRDIKRYRQWYLAPDVDLTKIKTGSKVLRSVFSVANVLKFPAPALEFSEGRLKVKAVAF